MHPRLWGARTLKSLGGENASKPAVSAEAATSALESASQRVNDATRLRATDTGLLADLERLKGEVMLEEQR